MLFIPDDGARNFVVIMSKKMASLKYDKDLANVGYGILTSWRTTELDMQTCAALKEWIS